MNKCVVCGAMPLHRDSDGMIARCPTVCSWELAIDGLYLRDLGYYYNEAP